jgi:hypothetical protein
MNSMPHAAALCSGLIHKASSLPALDVFHDVTAVQSAIVVTALALAVFAWRAIFMLRNTAA